MVDGVINLMRWIFWNDNYWYLDENVGEFLIELGTNRTSKFNSNKRNHKEGKKHNKVQWDENIERLHIKDILTQLKPSKLKSFVRNMTDSQCYYHIQIYYKNKNINNLNNHYGKKV